MRLENKNKDYWVITVLNGNTLTGFIPVYDKTSSLPDSELAKRELIKTAYVLRYYLQTKNSITYQRKEYWLFNADTIKYFNDLSNDLEREKIDLTTVKATLNDYPDLQADVDLLQEKLDELQPLLKEINDALLEESSFEDSFITKPDTNSLSEFEKKFQTAFDLILQLDKKRSDYLFELKILMNNIGETTLPLETRQGLNSLANVPNSFQELGSIASLSVRLNEKINAIFNGAAANVDSLVLDLSTRERRNNAMQALYGADDEILEKTGQTSLEQLIALLLNEDYFFMWNNQEDLANAKEDWDRAKGFYEAGSFEHAENNAESSKEFALDVYAAGTKEPEQPFDTDFLFTGVVLLIIVIIIIYALKNRDKISGLVSGEKKEDELNDWDA